MLRSWIVSILSLVTPGSLPGVFYFENQLYSPFLDHGRTGGVWMAVYSSVYAVTMLYMINRVDFIGEPRVLNNIDFMTQWQLLLFQLVWWAVGGCFLLLLSESCDRNVFNLLLYRPPENQSTATDNRLFIERRALWLDLETSSFLLWLASFTINPKQKMKIITP